jgi:hypothetical protein
VVAASFLVISVVVLTIGWIVGIALRVHTDSCNQPANLPTPSAVSFALAALFAGLGGLILAIIASVKRRAREGVAVALILGSVLAIVGGIVEAGWVIGSNLQICF